MCTHADNHNTWAVAAMDSCLFCSFLSWFLGGILGNFICFPRICVKTLHKKSKKKAEFSDCFQVCFPHYSCFTKANFFKATFTSAQFSFKFRKTIGKVLRNASLRVFYQMKNYVECM